MEKNEKIVHKINKVVVDGITFNYSEEVAKRRREMEDKDIEALSNVSYCQISSTFNKKTKRRMYTLTIHLLANQIVDNIPLTSQQFNIITASQGYKADNTKDFAPTRIPCKVRFLQGTSSADGSPYKSCEFFPLGSAIPGLKKNRIAFSIFVDENRITEFLIHKMLDKIIFRTASADEDAPTMLEDINY